MFRRNRRQVTGVLLLSCICSCSSLPSFGPSRSEIYDSTGQTENDSNAEISKEFRIVDINENVIASSNYRMATRNSANPFLALDSSSAVDVIWPGDVLSVSVFEAGPGLFSGRDAVGGLSESSAGPQAGADNITIPHLTVAADGTIFVPYAGRLKVAGHTTEAAANTILNLLKKKATQPQVVVERILDVANKAVVMGDARNPGRYPLTLAHERLLDLIATAGGPTHPDRETYVTLERHGEQATALLSRIAQNPEEDLRIAPGDRIDLRYDPNTYLILGASGRVSEIPFETESVTLAQGIARAGGLQDFQADPRGVFVFRQEQITAASTRKSLRVTSVLNPIIYHVNLAEPASYFLIQNFELRHRDIVYISDAPIISVQKLLGILNGVFTPVATSRTVAQ